MRCFCEIGCLWRAQEIRFSFLSFFFQLLNQFKVLVWGGWAWNNSIGIRRRGCHIYAVPSQLSFHGVGTHAFTCEGTSFVWLSWLGVSFLSQVHVESEPVIEAKMGRTRTLLLCLWSKTFPKVNTRHTIKILEKLYSYKWTVCICCLHNMKTLFLQRSVFFNFTNCSVYSNEY